MTISAGTTTEIDATVNDSSVQSDRINDTQMLVIYQDATNSLGARVCDINTGAKSITSNAQSTIAHGFSVSALSMARMSATKFMFVTAAGTAQVLNVSGTTVTGGTAANLTDTPLNASSSLLLPLTATKTLWIYAYGTGPTVDTVGRVLSIDGSDNITEGSSTILDSDPTNVGPWSAAMFDASTGVLAFQERSDSFFLKGQLFTISGTTVSLSGGVQTLYNAKSGWATGTSAAPLSSSEIATAHNVDDTVEAEVFHIISLSGSTLTAGATLQLATTELSAPSGKGVFTNVTTVLFGSVVSSSQIRVVQLIKAGTSLSHTASDFVNIATAATNTLTALTKIADDFALVGNRGSVEATVLGSDVEVKNYAWVLGGGQP